MTRGNKGGWAAVVCPELSSHVVFYVNPAVAEYENAKDTHDPTHIEKTSIDKPEKLIQGVEIDIAKVENEEDISDAGMVKFITARNKNLSRNNLSQRERREVSRRITRECMNIL